MIQTNITIFQTSVVEEEVHMTIVELCQAASTPADQIMSWVAEGVLSPAGSSPQDWRFSGNSLRRARLAAALTKDLDLNTPGVALALDLLEEIAELRARMQRSNLLWQGFLFYHGWRSSFARKNSISTGFLNFPIFITALVLPPKAFALVRNNTGHNII